MRLQKTNTAFRIFDTSKYNSILLSSFPMLFLLHSPVSLFRIKHSNSSLNDTSGKSDDTSDATRCAKQQTAVYVRPKSTYSEHRFIVTRFVKRTRHARKSSTPLVVSPRVRYFLKFLARSFRIYECMRSQAGPLTSMQFVFHYSFVVADHITSKKYFLDRITSP